LSSKVAIETGRNNPKRDQMAVVLETKDVAKVYQMGPNKVAALDGVSVAIEKGEYVAVQGTSGSGKSTLLNLLGALDHPTAGEILFEN